MDQLVRPSRQSSPGLQLPVDGKVVGRVHQAREGPLGGNIVILGQRKIIVFPSGELAERTLAEKRTHQDRPHQGHPEEHIATHVLSVSDAVPGLRKKAPQTAARNTIERRAGPPEQP